jgi:gliding motility-associated-like protein
MLFSLKQLVCFALLIPGFALAQYTVTPQKKDVDCTSGSAGIKVDGLTQNDLIFLTWSTGQTNVYSLSDLKEGDYYVHVQIKNKVDSVSKFDSTEVIHLDNTGCPVPIPNHFTPNGDNYNDTWNISNTVYFPNFELYVFNKWGQQVHSQKHTYTPWDGRWNGINVPDGTYYYVFYYDGGKGKHEKGDVTILR